MNWSSPADFLAMGGYGFYVWGSFGACALALALESWLVGRRTTAALRNLGLHVQAFEGEEA